MNPVDADSPGRAGSGVNISGLETDSQAWNAAAASLPNAHILQSWQWGEFKQGHGWQPRRLVGGYCFKTVTCCHLGCGGWMRLCRS